MWGAPSAELRTRVRRLGSVSRARLASKDKGWSKLHYDLGGLVPLLSGAKSGQLSASVCVCVKS